MEQRIGEKITSLRKAKNITQAQLAEYLHLVPQTVSKWEAGNGAPDISLLPRIADFFGISLDDLFGRSPLEHAKDLVLRYSVLRDDHCFQEALSCLQSRLQAVDAALKLEMRNPEELAREKIELEAYKMHLLLQQSWESAGRALEIAEEVAERTGDMRFRLQRVHHSGHHRGFRRREAAGFPVRRAARADGGERRGRAFRFPPGSLSGEPYLWL